MEDLIRLKKLGYELSENERIILPEDIYEAHENVKKSGSKFEEIEMKLKEIEYKPLKKLSKFPWIETLCVNDQGSDDSEIYVNQDKKREEYFYKIAARCTTLGLAKLKAMGIDFLRPSDYYTDMLKSDKLMGKIRSRMVSKLNSKNRNHNHSKNFNRKNKSVKKDKGKSKGKSLEMDAKKLKKSNHSSKDKKHPNETNKKAKKDKTNKSMKLKVNNKHMNRKCDTDKKSPRGNKQKNKSFLKNKD